ncbi:ABC transporter permease [Mesorhizobium loti]|uniref:ABC transporter permease n=1 Tax=Rhizobium loti TaxID=381 RepID=UPI0003FC7089|nr:ABC transporter permease [Mesorhizobium loti]
MHDNVDAGRGSRVILPLVCILIGIWLVLPLAIIVPISFSGEDSFAFPPRSWTMRRYLELADPVWTGAFFNSVVIGIIVAAISAVLGTLAAFAIARSQSRLISFLRILVLAPQIVPVIVVGLGVYLVFLRWHLNGTMTGFVLAHSAMALPFFVIPVVASLQTFDRSLERASASLGAGPLATFFQVTFPIIRPAVLSGMFLAFLASFDELVLALFLQSPTFLTLPVLLYRRTTDTIDPTVAAVATVELLFVTTCVVAALLLQSRRLGREAIRNE